MYMYYRVALMGFPNKSFGPFGMPSGLTIIDETEMETETETAGISCRILS